MSLTDKQIALYSQTRVEDVNPDNASFKNTDAKLVYLNQLKVRLLGSIADSLLKIANAQKV